MAQSLDFLVEDKSGGKSLEQLAGEFWKWVVTVSPPAKVSEIIEKNPNTCVLSYDSNNQTILLYNSYLVNTDFKCTIDSTKSILVPLLAGEADPTVDEPEVKTGKIEALWKSAADGDEDFKEWIVTLDDKVIFAKKGSTDVNSQLKEKILVRNSELFCCIHYPTSNNRYEMTEKDIESVNNAYNFTVDAKNNAYNFTVDGYYLHLKPIVPGEHTLSYEVTVGPTGKEAAAQKPLENWKTTYRFAVR